METVIEQVKSEECTGCGACMNACPVNAIKMVENEEGFIEPYIEKEKCINCGKCNKCCPKLNYENANCKEKIKVYAAYAPDEIRKTSSSGGIFTLLAETIFEMGGVVCGAAYAEDMQVVHRLIDNKQELEYLKGSKYVQSDVRYSYQEVKNALMMDKYVLFSGCPCQIAALKNYLGKVYEKLLTVDIICHGVPSYHTFKEYLETLNKGKVKNVEFRNKQFGWNCSHDLIEYEDGTQYIGKVESDLYLKGFLKNLFLRKSCENCTFSDFPRVGDITIGDFWGINNISPDMYDELGTSIVFVNSDIGRKYYNKIQPKLKKQKELDFTPEKYPNRVHSLYQHHAKRKQYFEMVREKGFSETVNYLLPKDGKPIYKEAYSECKGEHMKNEQHDIGLVANYYAPNFGGSMTQFALYHILKDMGYSVLMIEHPLDAINKTNINILRDIYIELPYPDSDMAYSYKDKLAMRELNDVCDKFVVGSDQQFQYELYKLQGKYVTLDWVDDIKTKIAYAASFGHGYIWGKEKEIREMSHFMKRFDAFSVRELSAVELCKDRFELSAEWVLDPVFVCDRKYFFDLAQKARIDLKSRFMGAYILDPSLEKAVVIKKLQKILKLECDIFSEFGRGEDYMKPLSGLQWHDYKVEERLCVIERSDFFVTDSFHGTCFAIIMRKPFITIMNSERGADRFISLLSHLGLSERLIENVEDLKKIKDINRIDYDKVYEILNKDIRDSYMWLYTQLRLKKTIERNDYNIILDKLYQQDKKIEELTHLIEKLSVRFGYDIHKITDINEYLNMLVENREKYIVFLSVKDTPGFLLNEKIAEKIKRLGFQTNLSNQHWHSFIGIVDEARVWCEKLSGLDMMVSETLMVYDLNIIIESRCLHAGNEAYININSSNYAINRRGLNFVVIEKESMQVVDSVCFDTHARGIPCYR